MGSVVRNSVRLLRRSGLALAGVTTLLIGGTVAHAQTVDQVLDSGVVTGPQKPQGVVQSPEVAPLYFTSTDAGGDGADLTGATNFDACQTIGTLGLFCIGTTPSGRAVLRWDNPDRVAEPEDVILCSDLGLASCTAMTVNLAGSIFVAGLKTGTTAYALVKLTTLAKQGGTCSGTWAAVPNVPTYCYRQGFSGRPRIYDLMTVDGPLDDAFLGQGSGVLALEDPAPGQITFYPDTEQPNASPTVMVTRTRWGNLLGNTESLQGLTLLQDAVADPARNIFMVTSSTGKVLGYEIDWSLRGRAFNTGLALNAQTLAPNAGTCSVPYNSLPVRYDLRASARTRRTFFVAGNCVAAYDPVISTGSVRVAFQEPNESGVLTSTKVFGIATDFNLTGVTVSPGIEIDFLRDGCTTSTGCEVIKNGNEVAARLYDLRLDPEVEFRRISGWLVFLVKGLPDCRYIIGNPAICNGAVVPPPPPADPTEPYDPNDPTRQFLNITGTLPPEILDLIPPCRDQPQVGPPDCLPPMLLQPEYRARQSIPVPEGELTRADYTYDALFGIPEPGLIYRDTFNAEFDIGDLFGYEAAKLGCGMQYPPVDPLAPDALVGPFWDVVVNISELAPTVGGPGPDAKQYVSVLLNSHCTNPTYLAGGRGSAFLYGLERAPNYGIDTSGDGRPDTYRWYDSTFALLMRSLARDYNENLYTYTCTALDQDPAFPGSHLPPLSPEACYNLQKDWVVTYDKLLKCVGATDQPKNSAGSEACTSFEKQFEAYKLLVVGPPGGLSPLSNYGIDQFNRVGEFIGRTKVLSYVYYEQFKKSIKAGGFINPN